MSVADRQSCKWYGSVIAFHCTMLWPLYTCPATCKFAKKFKHAATQLPHRMRAACYAQCWKVQMQPHQMRKFASAKHENWLRHSISKTPHCMLPTRMRVNDHARNRFGNPEWNKRHDGHDHFFKVWVLPQKMRVVPCETDNVHPSHHRTKNHLPACT